MKKIADMTSEELHAFLGYESITDEDLDTFDRYDNAHFGKDFPDAEDTRRYLIRKLIDAAFVGCEPDSDEARIFKAIKDKEDAEVLAEELINPQTFSEIELDVNIPEDYVGIDGYVDASRIEFIANLHGGYADDEELLKCFN